MMKSEIFILCGILATVIADCTIDGVVFDHSGPIKFSLPVKDNGSISAPYLWEFSPCALTTELCPKLSPGYVQYRPQEGCLSESQVFPNSTFQPFVVGEAGNDATFRYWRWDNTTNITTEVELVVKCFPMGPSDAIIADPNAAYALLTHPSADHALYSLQLLSRCACSGGCGKALTLPNSDCIIGESDFSDTESLTFALPQQGRSYNWTISLCRPTTAPPPCADPTRLGFIQRGDCQQSWPQLVSMASTASSVIFTFGTDSSPTASLAVVSVDCDPLRERGTLQLASGDSVPSPVAFSLTSRCACPGACPRGRDYWHRGQNQVATEEGTHLDYPEGYPGREFQSGQYFGVNLSPRQCGRACDAIDGCDSFFYGSDDGSCWLAKGASCQVDLPSTGHNRTTYWLASSGPCPRQLHTVDVTFQRVAVAQCNINADTKFEGEDIGTVKVPTVDQCCSLCADAGSCVGFTFEHTTTLCNLKGSITSHNSSTDHTSGTPGPTPPTPPPSPPSPPPAPPSPPPITCEIEGKYFAGVARSRFTLPLEHDGATVGPVDWEVNLCSAATDLCPQQDNFVQLRFPNGSCLAGFPKNTLVAAGDSGATFMYSDEQQSTVVVEVKCDPQGQRFNLHPQSAVAIANGTVPLYRITLTSRCACAGACGPSPPPDPIRDCGIGHSSFATVPPVELSLPLSIANGKPATGFTWGISLCSNSSSLCPASPPALVQRRADNSSLCTGSETEAVHMTQLRSISAVGDDTSVFVMSNDDGSQVAVVRVRCDVNGDATLRPDQDGLGAVATPDGQHYYFNLSSRCACANGCIEGARQYWTKGLHQYSVYSGGVVQYPPGFPNRASFNGTMYGKGVTLLQCEQACDYAAQCDSFSISGDGTKGDCFLYKGPECDTYTADRTTYWLQVGGSCPKPDAVRNPNPPAAKAPPTRRGPVPALNSPVYDPGCTIDDIDFSFAGALRFVLPLRAGNSTLGDFMWYINPCRDTSDLCPEWPQAFVQFKKPGAACGGEETSFVNRTQLTVGDGGHGTTFSFQSNYTDKSVTAIVSIMCNPTGAPDVVEVNPLAGAVTVSGPSNDLVYTIPLQSRCACPGQCGNQAPPINHACSVAGADFSSVVPLQASYARSDTQDDAKWVFSPCAPSTALCTAPSYVQNDDCDPSTEFTDSLAMAATTDNVTLFTFSAPGTGLFTLRVQCDRTAERSILNKDPQYKVIDVRGVAPNAMFALNISSRCACPGECPPARAYWHKGHGQISEPEGQDVPYPMGYPGRTPFGNSYYGLMVSKEQCARACDATALGSPSTLPCNGFTWSKEINGTCWLKHAASCSTKSAGAAGWASYWLVDGAPCPRTAPADAQVTHGTKPVMGAHGVAPRPTLTAAPTCGSEPGLVFLGDTLGSISAPLSSCCSLCSEIAGCQGFSYDVTVKRCDLKTNITSTQPSANATSGRLRSQPVSCSLSLAGLNFDNIGPVRFMAPKQGGTHALWEVSLCGTTTELCPDAEPGHLLEKDTERNCSANTFPELAFFGADPKGALFVFEQPNYGSARVHLKCNPNGIRDVVVPYGPVNVTGTAPSLVYDVFLSSLCACPGACGPMTEMPATPDCAIDNKFYWPMPPALFSAPLVQDGVTQAAEIFSWSFSPCSLSESLCPGAASLLAQRRDGLSACNGLANFTRTTSFAANSTTTVFHLSGMDANATVTVTCDADLPPYVAVLDPNSPNVTVVNGVYLIQLRSSCACDNTCKPPTRHYVSQGPDSLASDQGAPLDYPSSFPGRYLQNGTWCARGVSLQLCQRACDFLAPNCDSISWGSGAETCSLWHGSACSTFTSSNGLATYWLDNGRCTQQTAPSTVIAVVK